MLCMFQILKLSTYVCTLLVRKYSMTYVLQYRKLAFKSANSRQIILRDAVVPQFIFFLDRFLKGIRIETKLRGCAE